jgi:hypothetical protein
MTTQEFFDRWTQFVTGHIQPTDECKSREELWASDQQWTVATIGSTRSAVF